MKEKNKKYKIKKWFLIPIFVVAFLSIFGFSIVKPVNAYVDESSPDLNYGSLTPKKMFIRNLENSWGYSLNSPFIVSNQFVLPQPIGDGNIPPYISRNTLYDNFNYSHRIVAEVDTYLYGLDNWFNNYNDYNPFIESSNGNFNACTLNISGAYGSNDLLGGALENLNVDNLYLQFDYDSFFLPIGFLTNTSYNQQIEYYKIFQNSNEISISNLFTSFEILSDTDPLISAYSPLSLMAFSYRNNDSSSTFGLTFTDIDVRITYLKTGVYTSSNDIVLSSVDFIHYTPYSYISIPDILFDFYTNHFVSGSNGLVDTLYIDSMSISLNFGSSYESNEIRAFYVDSIYYTRMFDPQEEVLFFGDQWFDTLNGGVIGGNVGYNFDMTSWLVDSVGAFMNAELFPNFAIGGILAVLVAFPIVVWFLKVVLGG